jgi:hypothetical protein
LVQRLTGGGAGAPPRERRVVRRLVANLSNPSRSASVAGTQPGMRDRAFVIERGIDVIENDVRGSHRKGAFGSDE